MKKYQNNYAFIDSQNLNLGIRGQGWQLDFAKFFKFIKNKFRASKQFLFIGYIEKNKKLYSILEKIGYQIIFKPTIDLAGKTKGNVDAELVLHSMIELNNYDQAVLVSGDGDFYCLVKYLRENNKLKKLVVPNKYSFSSLLREFERNKNVYFLNSEKERLEYK